MDRDNPRDLSVEQASAELNQGLKMCRSVVNNYRAMLNRNLKPVADNDAEQMRMGTDDYDL